MLDVELSLLFGHTINTISTANVTFERIKGSTAADPE
jgi:hypothetical protein